MKITMYELLGLVKDGKAPKKIIHGGIIYVLDEDIKWYVNIEYDYTLSSDYRHIDDTVEILEEEKKIPEKLIPTSLKGINNLDKKIEIAHIDTVSAIDKINEIIEYLKSKGE